MKFHTRKRDKFESVSGLRQNFLEVAIAYLNSLKGQSTLEFQRKKSSGKEYDKLRQTMNEHLC